MRLSNNGNLEPNARSIIRAGVVSSVNAQNNRVRVTFPDQDNLVSGELQILTPFAGKNKYYTMPDVGEVVAVAMFGNDDTGGGVVLGSVFNDKTPPNANSVDVTRIDFSDGTSISYNRANHKLDINSAGDITINAHGNIKFTATRIDLN